MYLYDARYNIKKTITYKQLMGITGTSYAVLMSYKCTKRQLSKLKNCYIADENTSKDQYREWYEGVKLENEVWKNLDETYLVSNYGRVKKIYKKYPNGKFKLPFIKNEWQTLKIHGKDTHIHRLVAELFVDNPENYSCVWHKNGIKHDNYHANLEFISRKELGKKVGRLSNSRGSIIAYKDGEIIGYYGSTRKAEKDLFVNRQAVSDNLNGKTKLAGGMYKFEYDEMI